MKKDSIYLSVDKAHILLCTETHTNMKTTVAARLLEISEPGPL